MFGVGRQDAGPGLRRALHEEVARADEAFLVRKRNRCAAIHRRERRFQSGRAADGSHDPVRRPRRGFNDRAFASAAFGACAGESIFQLGEATRIGDSRKPRAEFPGQFRQPLHIGMRGQRLDLVAVARGPEQIHRAVADRTGGTEDGHSAHG